MMSNDELESKLDQIQTLKRTIEEAKAKSDALKDEIKQEMTKRNTETLTTNRYRVDWKMRQTITIDRRALASEYPEIAKRFTRITESKSFTIK